MKILFIDDQRISWELYKAIISFNHNILCEEFSLEEITPVSAQTLNEAKHILNTAVKENDFPNIIISDIQLVEATGFDFLELYKNEFLEGQPKTVVALITAYISDADKVRFENYSFSKDILDRPLEVEQLKMLMKEYFNRCT